METAAYKKFTLGQLFAVWGYPLTDVNVAGMTGTKVTAFIVDGDTVTRHSGKLDEIELMAHRDVVLVLGEVPAQLPAYQWKPGM